MQAEIKRWQLLSLYLFLLRVLTSRIDMATRSFLNQITLHLNKNVSQLGRCTCVYVDPMCVSVCVCACVRGVVDK